MNDLFVRSQSTEAYGARERTWKEKDFSLRSRMKLYVGT